MATCSRKRIQYGQSAAYANRIRELHANNLSAYKIGLILDIPKSTVLRVASAIGLSFSHKSKLKNQVRLKYRTDEVIQLYEKGFNSSEIAREMGYSQSSVYLIIHKYISY